MTWSWLLLAGVALVSSGVVLLVLDLYEERGRWRGPRGG
jgi:hypothetical protein